MIRNISKVLYILGESKRRLILLLLLTAITSGMEAVGIGMIGPFLGVASAPNSIHENPFFEWTYKQLQLRSSHQFIILLGLTTIGIFIAKSVLYILTSAYIFRFSYQQRKNLVIRILRSYLNAPYTFHLNKNTANIIENITSKTQVFIEEYLLPLQGLIVNAFIVSAILYVLAKTNLIFLEIIFGVLLIIFILHGRFGHKLRQWGIIKAKANEEIISIVNQSFGGVKETKIIGCESYFEEQMKKQTQRWWRAVFLFKLSQVLSSTVIQTSLILVVIIFICISITNPEQNYTKLSSVIGIFATASLRLIPASNYMLQATGRIKNSTYAVNVIFYELKEIENIEKTNLKRNNYYCENHENIELLYEQKNDQVLFTQSINLNSITFRYPSNSEDVIKSISLNIKKGQSVALIGKSGAGKTTLVDIILGLLEPTSGYICVDSVPIRNNLRAWQNLVGYIPQTIFLIDDTIERNIAFGVPDELIDSERLNQAIEMAQLTEMIEGLPDGIKTSVGERGIRLSGGQRQRIGIARALYHEREILVLDEATAALDNKTEQLVTEAIKSLSGKKTIITIAHRLSSVEHCDRVYLLDRGCIAKSGSYEEVVLNI